MTNRISRWVVGVGLVVLGSGRVWGVGVEPVVYQGESVPGGGGATFVADYSPVLTASMSGDGVVAAETFTDHGDNLLVVYGGGELRVLMNPSTLAGSDGVQYWLTGQTAISPDGRYVAGTVYGDAPPAGRTWEVYLWDREGDLSQGGVPVVRSATGGPLVNAAVGNVSINNAGVFHTVVTNLGLGGDAVYLGSADGFGRVVGQGDPLPGGGNVAGFGNVATGADGAVTFMAAADGWWDWTGIYRAGAGGGVEKIVTRNDSLPGVANAWLAETTWASRVSVDGRTAFIGALVGPGVGFGNDHGVWGVGSGGMLKLLAREGDRAPGEAANFTDFGALSMNGAGQVSFFATLAAARSDGSGGAKSLWVSDAGGDVLTKVAEVGEAAPGTGGTFGVLNNYGISDTGLVVVEGGLADGSGTAGLWVGRPGDLRLLLLAGDQVELNGAWVTVNSFEMAEGTTAITDDGRVLAQIGYSYPVGGDWESGQALVLLSVPEPAGVVGVGLVVVGLGGRRGRRGRVGDGWRVGGGCNKVICFS